MAGPDDDKQTQGRPAGTEAMPNTPLPDEPGAPTGAEGIGSGVQPGGTAPGGGPGAGLGSIGTGGGASGGAASGNVKRGGR
ncbi:hypothetical protein [Paracraurococcus lichenis]|uniref:Uncharacterized protein n=1 Tax=Paracraurococcus lichenis TaxID=3064888 RepID=A0ABT9E3N1_9PROT|nr:hypothetical protein [Paracraurococcus sp. LOR1-02]MDO9710690.1 hypothetical protein [Paracraurococcus sp. LOR1-02]